MFSLSLKIKTSLKLMKGIRASFLTHNTAFSNLSKLIS